MNKWTKIQDSLCVCKFNSQIYLIVFEEKKNELKIYLENTKSHNLELSIMIMM